MKRKSFCLALGYLLLPVVMLAQDVKIVTDDQCGCDIFYVNGIETTRDGDRYGFRREDGTILAPNIYRFVGQFTNGYCKVMLDDGQSGLLDSTGREVVPCIYDAVDFPSEGRILVTKNDRFGYTDMDGKVVIPLRYLYGGNFNEGFSPVIVAIDSMRSACTFIDTLGHQLFEPVYENLQPFSCGHALVRRDGRWGVVDRTGRIVISTRFENMTTFFADTLFFAGNPAGMALYDKHLEPLTKAVYTWVGAMYYGRIPVQRDGKYGFLDRNGHEVIPCIYDETGVFVMARTLVRSGDRYGIIDTTGRFVLPMEYGNTSHIGEKYVYFDSLALVEKNGKLGYVDLDGNLAIPLYFDKAYQFSEGLASVRHNGHWGYIDTHGDIFMPFVFDIASPYQWGRAEVYYNGVQHKVDRKGRCVKNCNGILAWRDWKE